MSIGTRIREARKESKLTQIELAKKVGMKQSTLSELETGESAGTTNLAQIAAALRVNALWLETGKGDRQPSLAANDVFAGIRPPICSDTPIDGDQLRYLIDLFLSADDRARADMIGSAEELLRSSRTDLAANKPQ